MNITIDDASKAKENDTESNRSDLNNSGISNHSFEKENDVNSINSNFKDKDSISSLSKAKEDDDSKSNHSDDDKPFIGLRWILVFTMFASYTVIFYVRNSIAVTIVAMINVTNAEDEEGRQEACPAAINMTDTSDSKTLGEFDWNAAQQGLILGAYFWGYLISRFFLSRIGEVIGQRQTVSIGIAGAGVLALLSPLSASLSPYALAANRFLTGVFYGPTGGSILSLLSVWAPRNELATMTTVAVSGTTVGSLLSVFTAGWLSENFSWHIVFYLGGIFNLLIPPIWMFFVKNSPLDHPLLSNYEKRLLMDNMKTQLNTKKSVPWVRIFTSPYVLVCIYVLFARIWLDVVTNTEGPTFLRYKIGVQLDTASYLSGVSMVLAFGALIFYGKLSDVLINKKIFSKTFTRKFFHIIAIGGSCLLLTGVIIADCNKTAVMVLYLFYGVIGTASGVTFNLSIMDIAPNFAATVNGLLAFGSIAGAIAPSVTSAFLSQENGWNKSFYMAIGLNIVSIILYTLIMTSKPQPWNFENEEDKKVTNSEDQDTKF